MLRARPATTVQWFDGLRLLWICIPTSFSQSVACRAIPFSVYLCFGLFLPMWSTVHLDSLKFMHQFWAHTERLFKQCCSCRWLSGFISDCPSLVSSANLLMIEMMLAQVSMSSMKMINKSGPSTEPGGTPDTTSDMLEYLSLRTVLCFLPVSQLLI